MSDFNAETAVEYLQNILEFEGTELSDVWEHLIHLWEYRGYLGDEFISVLSKELIGNAEFAEDNFKLVEKEITYTRKVKTLVEINE